MSTEVSDLEMDLMAAAVPAEIAPKGVDVVLLSDALQIAAQFLKRAAAQVKCDCTDPSQCWEPCGHLGKDERVVKVSET